MKTPQIHTVESLFDIDNPDQDIQVIKLSDLTDRQKAFLGLIPPNSKPDLKEKKDKYVSDKVEEIVNAMNKSNRTDYRISTCDARYWDTDLHHAMPAIAEKLREQGLTVTSCVRHGVTDWTISV